MKPPRFEYHAPTTIDEAVALLARYGGEAKVLAGGQSLVPLLNFRLSRPAALIDVNRIAPLAYVREDNGTVALGAMTRQRTIEFSPVVARRLPLLTEATRWVGHLPIRSRGTIGGSLAHADPSAEYPAVLTALDGSGRGPEPARPPHAQRRRAVRDVPDHARWPPTSCWSKCGCRRMPRGLWLRLRGVRAPARRLRDRRASRRWSCVTARGARSARLATAGAGPVPMRLRDAEAILERDGLGDAAIQAAAARAAELVTPDSDVHATAAYRRHLTGVLTARALRRAVERAR